MARGVNKVILIGNLGDEPTIRTTSTGKSVATISMVTNESRRNAETGEYTEFAEWHHVVLWGKLADVAKQYLHKGSQVYIEGKLRTRSYMDKQNQKR
ncbi:MAG: single-stranded DNA-binding protein, partial [Succinivibrio sp.]